MPIGTHSAIRVLSAIAILAIPATLAGCRSAAPRDTPRIVTAVGGADDAQIAQGLFELVNAERSSRGLMKLVWDRKLAQVAREYSRDMARRDFFSHTSPGGARLEDRLAAAGLGFVSAAENLGMNRGFSDPAADCLAGWLQSPGHSRNMFSEKYRYAGVGVARRADMTFFFTMIFRAHPDYGSNDK